MRWVGMLMLLGCGRAGPVAGDMCGAGIVAGLVGQPFVALAEVALPGPLRVVYPEQEVWEGVDAGRLNARIDGAGRIREVYCG